MSKVVFSALNSTTFCIISCKYTLFLFPNWFRNPTFLKFGILNFCDHISTAISFIITLCSYYMPDIKLVNDVWTYFFKKHPYLYKVICAQFLSHDRQRVNNIYSCCHFIFYYYHLFSSSILNL